MAELTGKAISELPEATDVNDSDLLALSQDASSKKVSVETLLSHVTFRTLLWSNLSGGLGAGDITLSSADYEYLEIEFKLTNGASDPVFVSRHPKGANIMLQASQVDMSDGSTYNSFFMSRLLTRNSDTSYTAGLGFICRMSGQVDAGQTYFCYPIRIWGVH